MALYKKREEEETDDEYQGMDEDELEEDETELLEEEETEKRKKPLVGRGRPPKQVSQRPVSKPTPKQEEVKERYMVFTQPPRVGIVDSETNEVVAEGELSNLQALANILERLERIEATIGSMIGEDR